MSSSISSSKGGARRAILQLLAFVFFLFLFDRLLFLGIRRGESYFYRGFSSYSLQDKFSAVQDKSEYQVLILGTSRTFDGIHPCYIQSKFGVKSFKEAFVGKGPMYNYFFYQEYRKAMGIPKVVIYGLDYFLFNITSERHWMKRFPAEQVDSRYFGGGVSLLLANKPRIDEFSNTLLNNLANDIAHDPNYSKERDSALMESYRGVVSPGKIDPVEPPSFRKIRFFKFPGKEGAYFQRLLEQLRRDRVKVMLVSLPEYIGTFWTNHERVKFNRCFKMFQKGFPNVRFFQYNRPRLFDLANLSYFIDGGYGKTNSHMSSAGAEAFSHLLLRDLDRYLRRK
jgi:hypothetical protein